MSTWHDTFTIEEPGLDLGPVPTLARTKSMIPCGHLGPYRKPRAVHVYIGCNRPTHTDGNHLHWTSKRDKPYEWTPDGACVFSPVQH
jgi:hypothetical protein